MYQNDYRFSQLQLTEIVILWIYYTIPLASGCFGTFGASIFNFLNY